MGDVQKVPGLREEYQTRLNRVLSKIGSSTPSRPVQQGSGITRVNSSTLRVLLQFKYKEKPESTCCNDVSYDPEEETMTIVFQKRGTYVYHDVPLDEYVDFASAGSQGTYFNLYIRPKFTNFERIA